MMSDILSTLQAAHAAREMVKVPVPEYGLDMHFPPFTVADHAAIRRGISPKDEHGLMVNGLVHMARDKAGARIFDVPGDQKPALMAELHKMELHVLQRIYTQASGGLPASVAAEIVAVDEDVLRPAMIGALDDQPELAAAVASVPSEVLQRALAAIAEAHQAAEPSKNG